MAVCTADSPGILEFPQGDKVDERNQVDPHTRKDRPYRVKKRLVFLQHIKAVPEIKVGFLWVAGA